MKPVLTKNKEFHRVYSKGKYRASTTLVVYYIKNSMDYTRIGITTSKKVGNAVKRNRMRRLIKENIRLLFDRLPKELDIVVVARKTNSQESLDSIGKELRYLLYKLGLLEKEK